VNKFEKDLGGYEYVIACFYGADVWLPQEGQSEIGDLMLERYRQIEEENNCTISFIAVTTDEFMDRANTAAAAGTKFADQVHLNMGMYGAFMDAGYLASISSLPYIETNEAKWNHDYYSITRNVTDGELYGLDFLSWPNRKTYPDQCLFFNKTLIAELGLPNPYDLYDQGQWTWDNFRQILKDSTRDVDGDGNADIYGITCVGDLLEFSALYSNGAHTFEIKNGKYEFDMARPATYNALNFTANIRNVDKTFLSFPDGSHWGMPLDTFKGHGTVFFMRDVIYFQDVKDNDHEFGMISFPKGPDLGSVPYPTAAWNGDTQVQGIFKIGNDVEKAAFIFNRITEPLGDYAVDDWKDYAFRNHFMRDEKAFAIYEQMSANATTDGYRTVYSDDAFNQIRNAIWDSTQQTRTPAEAFASITEEVQSFLDDKFNTK
jgi:hypothetical protein